MVRDEEVASVAKPSTFYFIAAALAVVLTTLVVLLGVLSLWRSSSSAETSGIGAVAGGISESVFAVLLAVATVFLFVSFFAVRKLLKKP